MVMRRVVWTLVPIASLGLLGWVPPLRIALRTRTLAAWLSFAGSAAGTVLVIVLVSTVRKAPGSKDNPSAWVGMIETLYIIAIAVYTGIATKVLTPKPRLKPLPPQVQNAYGWYPGQPPAYPPSPPNVAPPIVAPRAVDAAAAEVQAELRELRDLLGESAGGRQPDGYDRRGQW
jgi:hypothetical protein